MREAFNTQTWRQRATFAVCAIGLVACSPPSPLDDLQAGERGRVVKVFDGDGFVLDTGQSVRLACVEAPGGPTKKREGDTGYEIAKRQLEDMALGREVQLIYGGLTRDRYDRALAQVRTVDDLGPELWLNAQMIQRGGARVRVYPDTAAGCETFPALEREARAANLGLWGKNLWTIYPASALPDDAARFQIIEGATRDMIGGGDYGQVCTLGLEGTDLRLSIETGAAALCQSQPGTHLRVRGYVSKGELEVTHLLNVERLKPHAK